MGSGDYLINLPVGQDFNPSRERIQAWASLVTEAPVIFGRPADDREWWEARASLPFLQRLQAEAEECLREPVPPVTNQQYHAVQAGANVPEFNAALMLWYAYGAKILVAECMENEGRFLPAIESMIRSYLDLAFWVHPLNANLNLTHSDPIRIDLQVVRNATFFCYLLDWMGDRLSPELRQLMSLAVERRLFIPFEQEIRSGRGVSWWLTVTHNWNSVCLCDILQCALSRISNPLEKGWYLATVERFIEYTRQGFARSGFYVEGVSYWNYGFGHFLLAAEVLRKATAGRVDWLGEELEQKVLAFGARMEIQHGLYPVLADAHPDAKAIGWLTHWATLSGRSSEPAPGSGGIREIDFLEGQTLVFVPLLGMVLENVSLELLRHPVVPVQPLSPREWYDDQQFAIFRHRPEEADAMAVTAKGGNNGENHNHNDIGTFTVHMGETAFIIDPGLETYTERTFSPRRYEGELLNAFGHPVPIIGGRDQGVGRQYCAEVLETSFTDSCDSLSIEMRGAWNHPGLQSLRRKFTFLREGRGKLIVEDSFDLEEPDSLEISLITFADWVRDGDAILLTKDEKTLRIHINATGAPWDIESRVLQESQTPTRIRIYFTEPVRKAGIKLDICPS